MQTGVPLERLIQIPQAIAGQHNYSGVLGALARELGDILPFDHLDMVILVEGGRDHICFETPVRTIWSELAAVPKPTGHSPVRAVLEGSLPHMLSEDAFADERFHFDGAIDQPIYEATLRSRIIVPLHARNVIFGSISISRQRVNAYSAVDLDIAQHCADLIAPYLYALTVAQADARRPAEPARRRLLALAGHLEQERRRIGMDLHDQTIADLSRIARRLAAVTPGESDWPGLLSELRCEIGACLAELRRIVEDARPGILELFGFSEAIGQLLQQGQRARGRGLEVALVDRSEGSGDLLPDIDRTVLYRIVQEAINNAARHSGAGQITVRIARERRMLRVEIEDDGSGAVDLRSPGGVSHMRTRAALIEADLRFLPGPNDRGTCVSVMVPLHRPRRSLQQ